MKMVQGTTSADFFKDTFDEMLRADPAFATATGHHEFNDCWTDWSKAARDSRRQFFATRLAQLDTLRVGDSPQDQLTARLLRYDFALRLEAWDLDTHLLRVGQLDGFHNFVYNTLDLMPARSVRDYENIIARLRTVPTYVDQNLGILDEAVAAGIMQPRVVADLVIQQIDAQLAQDAEHTQLLKAFRAFPSNSPRADQDRLRREALEAFEQQFLPSWRKLRAYMAQHVPAARAAGGQHRVHERRTRRVHDSDSQADDDEVVGGRYSSARRAQEVARIEGEMQAIATNAGFTGSVADFQKKLDADPTQHFRSKEEMLANSRNIAMIIMPELPNQFRRIPALLFGVRPIAPDRRVGQRDDRPGRGARPFVGWLVQPQYLPAGKAGALRPGSARAARSDSGSHLSGCGGAAADHAARDPPLLLQ